MSNLIGSAASASTVAAANPNLLHNGDMSIFQRGAGPFTSATRFTNADDSYLLDGWIFLANGADTCDVSQSTVSLPTGSRGAMRFDVETGNVKFGMVQVVEAADSLAMIGGVASLQFKYKLANGVSIDRIRAAILAWSSTADVVTSDVVSNWQAQGTLPTLAANWTLEGETGVLVPTSSWQTAMLQNVAIDTASAANVAVFLWADDTALTVGDFLDITDVKLEAGPYCTPYVRTPRAEEQSRCLTYLEVFGADPLTTTTHFGSSGRSSSTTIALYNINCSPKLKQPTLMLSAVADFQVDDGANVECSGLTLDQTHLSGGRLVATVAAGLTTGAVAFLRADTTAAARIWLTAEL